MQSEHCVCHLFTLEGEEVRGETWTDPQLPHVDKEHKTLYKRIQNWTDVSRN